MVRRFVLLALGLALATGGIGQTPYFPSKSDWKRLEPAQAGFDPLKLAEAVQFAKAHESSHPRDFSNQEKVFGRRLGPIPKQRSGTKGLIVKNGYIVAEWGDLDAIEPTYSAAKSFLSTVAGVAVDRGLIGSVDDPVARYVHDGGYDSPHNLKVTWAHHLSQSSEWEGAMWGKPSTFLDPAEFGEGTMRPREIHEPGSYYEYNDVRINRLALSLLRVFGRSLPDVLRAEPAEHLLGGRLVVVLDEVEQPPLELRAGALEVPAEGLGRAPRQPLVQEVLVVAEVEPLLLERPLAAGVGLGHGGQGGMRPDLRR